MQVLTATVKTNTMGGTTFSIPRPATIPSDNAVHKVTIVILSLESELTRVIVPRKSNFAYIQASATNDSLYSLLAGTAKVFYDGSFITTLQLATINVAEKFECFLGVDEGLRIESTPSKHVADVQGVMNKSRVEKVEKTITIRNQTPRNLVVVVREQLPRSQDEKAKVKLIEPNLEHREHAEGIKLDAVTNNLEWKFTIESSKHTKLTLKYSIECPSDKVAVVTEAQ